MHKTATHLKNIARDPQRSKRIDKIKNFLKNNMAAWEDQAKLRIGAFNSQELSNSLWSYATLGIEPSCDFMAAWEDQARGRINEFNAQELSNSLWSLGVLDSISKNNYKVIYDSLRPSIRNIQNNLDQKQIRDVDLWFEGESVLSNVTHADENNRSQLENNLRHAFNDMDGFIAQPVGNLIDVFNQAVDFTVAKEGHEVWVEVDGSTHYVRQRKTGEVRLNGATQFRSALMQKFAPEAKIVRIGWQLSEEICNKPEALSKIHSYFSRKKPGVYLMPPPRQENDRVMLIEAKRPL